MTVDDQIRRALVAEPLGPPPSAADRAAVDQAATGVRRRRSVARSAGGALVALLVVLAAVVMWPQPMPELRTGASGAPEGIGRGDVPDGWTSIVEPTLGWTMSFPEDWRAASVSDQCRIGEASTIVASVGGPPPYRDRANGCTTERDWNDVPAAAVLIGLTYRPERFPSDPGTSVAPVPDTPFPLIVPPAEAFQPQDGGSFLSVVTQRVVVGGDAGYSVTVWFGTDASDEAKADARLAVSLLRPPPDDELVATTSTVDPSWRTVALPSVTPLPPDEPRPAALLTGTLVLEGDCLFVDGAGGQRTLLVWTGDEVHMVIDADGGLVGITVDGGPVQPVDPQIQAGGGYYSPGMSPRPIHNLSEACRTSEVFIS
jgi:hypothetical protein